MSLGVFSHFQEWLISPVYSGLSPIQTPRHPNYCTVLKDLHIYIIDSFIKARLAISLVHNLLCRMDFLAQPDLKCWSSLCCLLLLPSLLSAFLLQAVPFFFPSFFFIHLLCCLLQQLPHPSFFLLLFLTVSRLLCSPAFIFSFSVCIPPSFPAPLTIPSFHLSRSTFFLSPEALVTAPISHHCRIFWFFFFKFKQL